MSIRPSFTSSPLRVALALIGSLLVAPAWSACTVAAHGLDFGSYDVFAAQDLDGAGNLVLSCDLLTSYSISLGPGGGSYDARVLAGDLDGLVYNLYTDVNRTMVWGDGSGSTSVVSGTADSTEVTRTVYGRIPAGQNVGAGNYQDTVVVTVSF